jgi:hypothetical protein
MLRFPKVIGKPADWGLGKTTGAVKLIKTHSTTTVNNAHAVVGEYRSQLLNIDSEVVN